MIERFTEEDIAEITEKVLGRIESDSDLSKRLAWVTTKALVSNPDIAADLIDGLQDKFPQSVLSGDMIKKAREEGWVVIEPYKEERVKTSSYDISAGEWYWTTRRQHPGPRLFNPYNPGNVRKFWQGPFRAKTVREHLTSGEYNGSLDEKDFEELKPDDSIILLSPGETILSHTEEYIGGKDKVTSMMKARSSLGRIFLSVCKDAGWGDVGYFNRWTMEIHNNLNDTWLPVVVRQPIAQLVFFRVNPVENDQYSTGGSYQSAPDLAALQKNWNPEMMLPRLRRVD